MGHRCCSKQKVKRGLWSPEEDEKLVRYITAHGHGSWSSVPKLAGLQRCGKSCRLRWINYLRPELKRGSFSAQEEQIIIDVHRILGNRWAQIAKHLPGRTDNEVKNFWNSCIKKKLISQGLDPKTHNLISSHQRNSISHNNKVVVCSSTTLLSQPHHQQPFSIFTVNQQQQQQTILTDHHHIDIAPMDELNPLPPFLTLPSLPPPQQTQHQNPNPPVWSSTTTARDQQISFPCGSSFSSPSSSNLNPNPNNPLIGFGFSDENSLWNVHQGPRPEQILQTHQNNNISEMGNVDIMNGDHHHHHEHQCGGSQDIDHVSFDSSSFDLELVESALLSGAICRDLTSMDDLAWNF